MSTVRDFLFSIFAATFHIGVRSYIYTQTMRNGDRDPRIKAKMYEITKFSTEDVYIARSWRFQYIGSRIYVVHACRDM
jgi:hypothetical protein